MRHGNTTISWNQNDHSWRGNIESHNQRKTFKMYSSAGKVICNVWGMVGGVEGGKASFAWIFSGQTINSDNYLVKLTKLYTQTDPGQRNNNLFRLWQTQHQLEDYELGYKFGSQTVLHDLAYNQSSQLSSVQATQTFFWQYHCCHENVGCFCWCWFLQAWHPGSCLLHWENGGDYMEK